MRTYKLTIAYDGTRYQGWQRQANTDRTIQGILEKTIGDMLKNCGGLREGRMVEVNGSGRTDAGVHARGQTASIVLPGLAEEGFFTETVNSALPADIRILNAELEKNGFHARRSAVGKAYEYYIDTGEKADVFTRRCCYHYPHELDLDRMREANPLAEYISGKEWLLYQAVGGYGKNLTAGGAYDAVYLLLVRTGIYSPVAFRECGITA